MDVKTLNKTLKDEAISLGLCAQWTKAWREGWDRNRLISKYKEGIDFCMKHDFPTCQLIKENFSRDMLRDECLLVDDNWSLINPKIAILQGNSISTIRYNGWNAGTVYVRHTSHARIEAKNMTFVIVHLLNEAKVDCVATDKAKIVVLRHDENTALSSGTGNVVVKDELDYLKK